MIFRALPGPFAVPFSGALPLYLAVLLALVLGACDTGGGGSKKNKRFYTETHVLADIVGTFDAKIVSAKIPETAAAIGVASIGTNGNYKVIDHGCWLSVGGNPVFITDPKGNKAPLSFSDTDGMGGCTSLVNIQAPAVLFPNNGEAVNLAAGTWKFPIASFDATGTTLEADTMTTVVYYKTKTTSRPALNLNVWVLSGVTPGIIDDASAAADPEIQGALAVLANVYEKNASTDIAINARVRFVSPAVPSDVIATDQDMYKLVAAYPSPAENNAMNIFVVTRFDNLPAGVIGLALGLPGPFNHQGTAVSGTLAEYQGDGEGITLGYILAHEFGHYLGLYHSSQTNDSATSIIGHDPIADTAECTTAELGSKGNIDKCPDRHNLMFPYVCDPSVDTGCDNPDVSQGQGNVVRYNPGVTP